jgi:hypothetical protein
VKCSREGEKVEVVDKSVEGSERCSMALGVVDKVSGRPAIYTRHTSPRLELRKHNNQNHLISLKKLLEVQGELKLAHESINATCKQDIPPFTASLEVTYNSQPPHL